MRRIFCALVFLGTLACNDSTSPDKNAKSPDLATLGVGRVRTLSFNEMSDGLSIPADLSDADYLVVVSNINMTLADASNYVVRGDRGRVVESAIRTYERRTLSGPRFRDARLPALRQQRMPGVARVVAPPNVGDQLPIRVLSDGLSPNICQSFVQTTGTVRAVGTRAIIVSDNDVPANGFTLQDYQNIAAEFDTLTYPTGVGYFGDPTDIDDNARIIIYYTPRVNEMTAPGRAGEDGYVGGFFFAGDLFTRAGCNASNEAEIFYLLAPDPTGTFGNQFQLSLVRQVTRGTVAHEFQHMINSGHRFVRSQAAEPEVAWLDEALAHFAEDATGRVAVGIGDLAPVNLTRMNAVPDDEYNAFFVQNFARARAYINRPDTIGPIGSEPHSTTLAARGASWALIRYAADWFSGNNPRNFTRALATGPDTGVTNLVKQAKMPLDSIMSRWLVTLYTDHMGIAGLSDRYNYRSYDFRGIVGSVKFNASDPASYTLPVASIGDGNAAIPSMVPSSSAAYFLVNQGIAGNARLIRVTNGTGDAVLDPDGRVYVVRLR